jgi:circadian clock protein KaiB
VRQNLHINSISDKYKFILFISGMSSKSATAIENLRRICDEYLQGNFELEIIDISKNTQMAIDYEIIGIPTLIKLHPLPKRIILGDLSETEKVLRILEIER